MKAKEELIEFVKECFDSENEVKFFISERGNQRIEIKDLKTGEVWQTLEGVSDKELDDDFEDISGVLISSMIQMYEG